MAYPVNQKKYTNDKNDAVSIGQGRFLSCPVACVLLSSSGCLSSSTASIAKASLSEKHDSMNCKLTSAIRMH